MFSSTFYGVIEINLIMLLNNIFRTEFELYASITGKQINEPKETRNDLEPSKSFIFIYF